MLLHLYLYKYYMVCYQFLLDLHRNIQHYNDVSSYLLCLTLFAAEHVIRGRARNPQWSMQS